LENDVLLWTLRLFSKDEMCTEASFEVSIESTLFQVSSHPGKED
jgi:hypothetical protein